MTANGAEPSVIALAMGDPAGVSPELTARLLALPDVRKEAHLIVFGDRRILDEGAHIAGVELDLQESTLENAPNMPVGKHVFIDLRNLDPKDVVRSEATLVGGTFATQNFRTALEFADAGHAQAVCFTPFNKQAMRFAYPGYDDEIRFVADVLGFKGKVREFNVLEKVWNARVTSHIPLKDVAATLTVEGILAELELAWFCLKKAGHDNPKIAVAGLNPHAGDGGSFGMEEIDVIEPAVKAAKAKGFDVDGPFPADTVFLRALKDGFQAVLTMYHDQGQIAMKLMGFDKGVTMMGGLPFPLCTPAHGTAYDIAGKGVADVGATREAILLAARMAKRAAALSDAA
ncbi:4-hydroxythreonine-4-phosphate dehydrogenase PdxA [Brucellaceae bacterium VT-16-1752]|uniref:4-hydroxythreonine-4-phosphate dehydrogenase PdxA n=1 Tax=Ochrobactrum soli TaxID=2448455 RepID=A0A849KMM2_9HYPH|nr:MULTISPECIES: 4-hydroxythreonine-4-phosphate dehydrogenase PdxA [Brucella]MCI0999344.1 4-hydroxythreonine-4-phosphate dehydrogenase PdxA [Ochrobactrum sp. C6C9]RRD22173.1 4-hydroxythreonine-4-phosphate dehydrogenase PdxA [Brucellaceae bacterium VT-16-1752]WHT45235.1 4-hydroxythreonine-4-phosphate dehydrogenase PdxA [Ochrobactrum sp. SSR]NNU60880.1 4-hydroxythreonine-4-phosphate dehydrogenase PdxA [[Ochrobactrum] soli]WHS30422.1 4-hydroxythreonine-4-phosphate dehydrogenase PdxA [Brucella sp.